MVNEDETYAGSQLEAGTSEKLAYGLLISLEVVEGPDLGLKYQVTRTRTLLGRKAADLVLTDNTVSGKHAILEAAGPKIFITDNGSTNGTTLNGEAVESGPCGNMDEIGLGDTRLLLSVVEDKYGAFMPDGGGEVDGEADDEQSDDSRVIDLDSTAILEVMPNPELDRSLRVVLDVIGGPAKGEKFQVANRSTVIGRGERADFIVDDDAVSNRHCQIEIHNKDKMTIKDLASSNGTRLNDQYVSAVILKQGDTLQIGETRIKIHISVRR